MVYACVSVVQILCCIVVYFISYCKSYWVVSTAFHIRSCSKVLVCAF